MRDLPQNTSEKFHRIFPNCEALTSLFQVFLTGKMTDGFADKTIQLYFDSAKAFSFLRIKDFDRPQFIDFVCGSVHEKHWAKRTLVNHLRRLCAFNRFLFYQSLVLRLHRAPRMSNRPKRRNFRSDYLVFENLYTEKI